MVKNVTYHNPINQEENTPLVTILETRVDIKQSTAVDSRKSPYVIDLMKASFGGITYPEPGSQWYLKKISGVWALMARATQQNPQLDPGFVPVVGDTYIGHGGKTVIVGDLDISGVTNLALDDLSDVNASSPSTGQTIRWTSGEWQQQFLQVDDLSDAVISSPVAGDILRYDGANWVNNGNGFIFKERVLFAASGTFTKGSYAGLRAVRVVCVGGGGGGGGSSTTSASQASVGAGGGGGGMAEGWLLAADLGTNETVTIGAAGTAGTAGGTDGGTGGTTSFGTLVVATGGTGGEGDVAGTADVTTQGGVGGGASSTGEIIIRGNEGGVGVRIHSTATTPAVVPHVSCPGVGGSSPMGPGGRPSAANSGGPGVAPTGSFGGGGSGSYLQASQTQQAGGAGRIGFCYVDVYI